MTDKNLRKSYLHDLGRAPEVLAALRHAKRGASAAVTLAFDKFADDPFLLYACCGLAGMDGTSVTVVPSGPRPPL